MLFVIDELFAADVVVAVAVAVADDDAKGIGLIFPDITEAGTGAGGGVVTVLREVDEVLTEVD
jgi:hypothetical protein